METVAEIWGQLNNIYKSMLVLIIFFFGYVLCRSLIIKMQSLATSTANDLDDSQGKMLTGILVEGRYRIEDVRKRTVIRSEVLQKVLEELIANNIPVATTKIRFENERHWGEVYAK